MLAPQSFGLNSSRALAAHAFLAHAHASFDCSLRRFFARRGVARDEIGDLTQEVYLRLARRSDLATIRSAQAFVFVTAANLLHDRFRRRAARGCQLSFDDEQQHMHAQSGDPQKEVECEQRLRLVLRAILSLKPSTRRAFVGHRLQGLSYTELAHELGVSVSMIEKHMIAAIAILRPLRETPPS